MRFATFLGLARSLLIYYNPLLQRRTRKLYQGLIHRGDLVFDVGAHVGSRARVLRRCGARVVAFEPQPLFARFLRHTLPKDVVLVEAALGPTEQSVAMAISARHPTVSSLRASLPEEAQSMPGFEHVRWDEHSDVQMTTLDAMIARFGTPAYIKIDVEGFEAEVLSGLSSSVKLISVEYLPALPDNIGLAIRIIAGLGNYEFNVVRGENPAFDWNDWRSAANTLTWLSALEKDAGSGDIYARLC